MTRRPQALCFVVALTLSATRLTYASGTEDVPLPGGTRALARVLALDPAPEPARALAEFARIVHALPEGANKEVDLTLNRLEAHVRAVVTFEKALAAVQGGEGGISLSLAADKNTRNRLKNFLDLVGLNLIEKKQAFSVQPSKSPDAADRVHVLDNVGVDLGQLAVRLNKGDTVRLEVPNERVPVPISVEFWSRVVFKRAVAPEDLIAAILSSRKAAFFARGLMGLDDETLTFIEQHPALAIELYDVHASAFAAFAASLMVRGGRLQLPGGSAAQPLWEKVVDRKVAQPEEFVRELFSRHGGKLAYLYSAIADMDQPRRAFALGLWIGEEPTRIARFELLVNATLASVAEWDLEKRPFFRPSYDAVGLLAKVRVESSGGPSAPNARRFWEQALEGSDLSDDPARLIRNLDEGGVIDAAWIVNQMTTGDFLRRAARVEQFAFGQRVFQQTQSASLGDALIALRALRRFPALILALDRAGVRNPTLYALLARQADVLTGLDPNKGHTALRQFQGAVALVERLARTAMLDRAQVEALVEALAAVRLNGDGWYEGAVAAWLEGPFRGAIGAITPLREDALIDALAGLGGHDRGPSLIVKWEDRPYRVDLPAAEARRVHRIRDKQKTVALDTPLALQRTLTMLSAAAVTVADAQAGAAELKKLAELLAPRKLAPGEWPIGVDLAPNAQQMLTRAAQELAKITQPRDARRATRIAESLSPLADRALADSLTALVYAFDLGEADSTALFGGDASIRHDFGFADVSRYRRGAWDEPRQQLATGRPWSVQGSLLGIDVALAKLSMRRLTTDKVEVPKIGGNDQDAFMRGFALLNPYAMRDEEQRAIAAAIAKGKTRVERLATNPETLALLADEIGLDGWRRRAVAWTLQSAPERSATYFSMAELMTLGGIDPALSLDGWGTTASVGSGCLCTELDGRSHWSAVTGRQQLGLLPSEIPDLHLRVAVALQKLGLPAVLAKGVLAAVERSFIDEVRPMDADDWLAFVRAAQATSDERIEDAVASLTASGPLMPATVSAAAAQPW